jgi:hypothetical protein
MGIQHKVMNLNGEEERMECLCGSVKLWLEGKQGTMLSTVGVIFPCLKVNSDKSEM